MSATPAVAAASFRAKDVLEDLERLLLEFMRKHQITHEQYRIATQFLVDTVKQGEESLLYDLFFEAESTDIANRARKGSPEAIEGPFYLGGAPKLHEPYVMPMRDDERGDILIFMGSVRDIKGSPVVGAELELWHADADGRYSNIHPNTPPWNLRGRFKTDQYGNFEVRTIMPPPYEISKDGPTGQVLKVLGRHFFRPAHLHVKLRHPGLAETTSQIFFSGGKYIDSDVANAVRDGLIAPLERCDDENEIRSKGLDRPYYVVRYEFVLPPER